MVFIRKATQADIPFITESNIAMAKETENLELPYDVVRNGVRNLFSKPEYGFYIVAEEAKKIVACLMITYEWTDWRNGIFWWIQSVYVLPEYRRRGIFRNMYKYVKNLANKNPEVRGLRLYVEKENEPAKATYKALGMRETPYLVYEELV